MSRRIVAALAIVFACGCGGPPASPPKAESTNVSTGTDVKKVNKKKGSNSTSGKKSAAVAPVVTAPVDVAAKETPAEDKAVAAVEKTPAEKPEVIPASFTKSVTLSVPDMHCEFACFPKVKKTLESVAGVAGIKPDIKNHTVTFRVDPAKYEEEKTLAALKAAEYPATVKVADSK